MEDKNHPFNKLINWMKTKNKQWTVQTMAEFGYDWMRREKIHPHFFGTHSLKENALYLVFFSLNLPYDFKNKELLNQTLSEYQAKKILDLFEKRIKERIPVEYITHEAFYLGNRFYVDENVLIPRSLMNTRFEDFLNEIEWENYKVLDLCTGSGCIGITLALLHNKIQVHLSDISEKALEVAEKNIKLHQLEERVQTIQGNLFDSIQDKYDLIISNPPYVIDKEYAKQPPEVKNEPSIALKGGEDGLSIINTILLSAKNYLNPKGTLIIEVGYEGAKQIKRKYGKKAYRWHKYRNPAGQSLLDWFIQWTPFLDSILVCRAKDLPKK